MTKIIQHRIGMKVCKHGLKCQGHLFFFDHQSDMGRHITRLTCISQFCCVLNELTHIVKALVPPAEHLWKIQSKKNVCRRILHFSLRLVKTNNVK